MPRSEAEEQGSVSFWEPLPGPDTGSGPQKGPEKGRGAPRSWLGPPPPAPDLGHSPRGCTPWAGQAVGNGQWAADSSQHPPWPPSVAGWGPVSQLGLSAAGSCACTHSREGPPLGLEPSIPGRPGASFFPGPPARGLLSSSAQPWSAHSHTQLPPRRLLEPGSWPGPRGSAGNPPEAEKVASVLGEGKGRGSGLQGEVRAGWGRGAGKASWRKGF